MAEIKPNQLLYDGKHTKAGHMLGVVFRVMFLVAGLNN